MDSPPVNPSTADPPTPDSRPPSVPDSRPPGGTRRSGVKTPRRVQWMSDTEGVSSTHALDEHGLNPEPFKTLTHALEAHRSSSMDIDRPALPSRVAPNSNGVGPFSAVTAPTALSPGTSVPSSPEMTPIHNLPGEVFIDQHETAGLPGRDPEAYSQRQAEKAVRTHRLNFLKLRGKHARTRNRLQTADPLMGDGKGKRRSFFQDRPGERGSRDVEKFADVRAEPSVPAPRGVLSTLLSIYEPAHAMQSGPSTARSSWDDARPSHPYEPTPLRQSDGPYPPWMTANTGSTSSIRSPKLRGFSLGDARPPKSSSGAGVFGPLIASAGNITGVAAPMSATVAPDLKRPGYHLSRYSLESVPKEPKRALSRSNSLHFDSTRAQSTSVMPPSPSVDTISPHSSQSPTPATPMVPAHERKRFSGTLKDLPKFTWTGTPASTIPSTPATDLGSDEFESGMEEKRPDKRRHRRRKAEIWITRHVAEIVCRQEFIMKFARAMMMFGGPTHRMQALIMATGKVLDIQLSCMYLPDVMLISFEDASTSTSNIKFIRQGSSLDIGKLQEANELYWKVIHDEISVKDASIELDTLMRRKPMYKTWQTIVFGGMCSAAICSVSFNGSFVDSLVAFPLGCLLIVIQMFAARNELYSNVFEITVATMFSFICAALSSVPFFCYSAIASGSVVLILPGFIVLCGSLELTSRNIVSGAVRVCFACIYSLFLGFGLAIGATAYSKLTNHRLAGSDDLTCGSSHDPDGPWWQRTAPLWWAFLTVPMYSLSLSLRNHAPWNRRELYLLVAISCIGWVTNHFTGTRFKNQSDISAAVGALAVGFVSNVYGRLFHGSSFVVMITGILFQLPSGLANGGLFTFVSQQESGSSTSESYVSGFQTALQLISVSIGLTVGLGISLLLVHPIPSRRRAAGMFTL
ncbi:uncharacterized protein BXZ73DRAFT_99073 [Epithele typhae]|uniref:uncharacterized protein n=1 Tax=Epithele typhae TaxID=378194 RepID=UPI002007417F|nr:uncharacterized protein BXZ73DRAFT_99073 [Epithele typhae]KAH9940072.1 hypothetical protein BXZ73DRAFT_99073 [Epithele typhae]